MRILDYLIFWIEKFHLNLSKSPHTLGEWLKVPGEKKKKKEDGNIFAG